MGYLSMITWMSVVAWVHKIATKCGDEQITGGKCFANNRCKWCSVNADGYIAFVHNDVALLPFVSVSTQYKSHSFCLTLYIIRKQVTDSTTKGRGDDSSHSQPYRSHPNCDLFWKYCQFRSTTNAQYHITAPLLVQSYTLDSWWWHSIVPLPC